MTLEDTSKSQGPSKAPQNSMNFKKGTSKLREGTGKSTSQLRDVNLM